MAACSPWRAHGRRLTALDPVRASTKDFYSASHHCGVVRDYLPAESSLGLFCSSKGPAKMGIAMSNDRYG
jgi:hypothetical protein